jgi:hypothetical protein
LQWNPKTKMMPAAAIAISTAERLVSGRAAWMAARQGFPKMINTLARAAALGTVLTLLVSVVSAPAVAQGPTEAQREAVKSECRSDYIAHCSSVPPGGEASLQCLAKNMSSLSGACQAAVRAVEATVEAPKPAAAAPATPAAKSATPPAAAAKPAAPAAPSKSAAPKQPAPTTAAAGPAAAAGAAPAPLVLRQMLPREELFVTRSACRTDIGTLCQGVVPGGGRIMQCLQVRSVSLSSACRDVLLPFSVQ